MSRAALSNARSFIPMRRSDRYVEEAKKLRDVQVYLWFARFPIWQVKKQQGQTIVEISDVRFFRGEEPDADAEAAADEVLAESDPIPQDSHLKSFSTHAGTIVVSRGISKKPQ